MRRHLIWFAATSLSLLWSLSACGGGESSAGPGQSAREASSGGEADEGGGGEARGGSGNEFQLSESDDAEQARGERPSEIEATRTHAAMRLFVVDRDEGPISGVVIKMTDPEGTAFYTRQTDSMGYAEVLVPVGRRYEIEYLSLGRRNTMASVEVPEGPNQDIRLTMRYRRPRGRAPARARPQVPDQMPRATPVPDAGAEEESGFVLEGVLFETGSARIQAQSHERLDRVVEYLTHRPEVRLMVAGHTDNVGNPARNLQLSEQRAEAVKAYLVEQGIDAGRIDAVGFGDSQPVASNDTEEGRAQNRRIEAMEL